MTWRRCYFQTSLHTFAGRMSGAEKVQHLLEWLCTTPKTTCIRVNLLRSSTDDIKSLLLESFKKHHPSSKCPNISAIKDIPEVILIDNLKECNDLVAIPDGKEVVVDVSCSASILRGAHLYAPGVLSMETNTGLNENVNIFADIDGICKRGATTFESPNKRIIATGTVLMQRHQLFRNNMTPSGIAIEIKSTLSQVPSIGDSYLPAGRAMLQNLPSVICAHVLNPKPGETLLDMCAAPGNKTSHLAELMKDKGLIIAIDKTPNKLKILEDKMKSYQFNSVKCFAYDSTKLLSDDDCGYDIVEPPFPSNCFDKILLDAPCSALGNRPVLRNDISPKMLRSYPVVQKKLFKTAVELLKRNGILVYSTCTVTSAENEEIVEWALNKFDNIELISADPLLGGPGWSDVGLSDEQRILVQRFGPDRDRLRLCDDIYCDTVGFFIAKFRKR
ncbi:tRNA (cytosine(72)-C(5))-methyltransferase NSUN6 isoform X2 [Bradysia coprophila]|uniref:tRNA (cytosine(72)-C(5))-methyltransferase NSUN6 isoform X2 n=1 Tax=Bradysia coprophila TaxID=38358 RepID=UPI00187D9146|nr:tRNA (cytosine(72)-C(5))-methyltransferase NSUN6 isoform X2 [Bradysia coprophila]